MNKGRLAFCLLFIFNFSLFASERLEWSDDENVFEYTVEIKNRQTGEIKSFTTQKNYIEINEQSGDYEFRVKPVDMLGREGKSSAWQGFKISKAMTPVLSSVPPAKYTLPEPTGESVTIPVDIQNVSGRTSVQLINQDTKQVVEGQLVIKNVNGLATATGITVPLLSSGKWKIRVVDASGRSSESSVIKIENPVEEKQKAIAATKALEKKEAEKQAALATVAGGSVSGASGIETAESGAEGFSKTEVALAEQKAEETTEVSSKNVASSAQKLKIEKQIARRVRSFQKKVRYD